MVEIEMVWLSLKSCDPITVTTNGVDAEWDVHVGLSERTPPIQGRMRYDAQDIRPGGGGNGVVELGDSTDPVNQAFESGNFNFFNEDQSALGLPVAYQLLFIRRDDPTKQVVFDDPSGQSGIKSLALFTNDGNPDGSWHKRQDGEVYVRPGLDCWSTPCGSSVAVPVTFGPGFFGPGSQPVTVPEVKLEGHPFDYPWGPPPRFPDDQLSEMHVWLDEHGNRVGPQSAHKVSQTVLRVEPEEPYNFDTIVERLDGARFSNPGEAADVPIELVWLSLKSCDPITVSYDTGPDRQIWMHVGLSNRSNELHPGRVRLTADRVDEAGGRFRMDLGKVGDPVDQQFEQDPLAFAFDPNHLGLPLYFQIAFIEDGETAPLQPFDDPDGEFSGGQLRTIAVFHNELGGDMKVIQAGPGDANLDGRSDAFDIDAFVNALVDPDGYRRTHGADPNLVGDLNGDEQCNAFDIGPFVELLTGRKTMEQVLAEIQRASLNRVFPVLGVDPLGWQATASAPFGFLSVQNIAQGLADLESPNVAAGNFDALNFADPESNPFGAGNFLSDVPFPSNTPLDDDDFALLAEATLVVPRDSDYDIGFRGDDGSFLTIEGGVFDQIIIDATGNAVGVGTDTITCDCLTGDSLTVGRIHLAPGEYPIRAFLFERSGGAHLEVFGGQTGAPKRLLLRNGAGFESLFDGLLPEIAGGSPLPVRADPDLDGDGVDNIAELRTGTDPLDPTSFFRIDYISVSDERVELRWPSMPGGVYDIEHSESATPGSWTIFNDAAIVAEKRTTTWIGPRPAAQAGYYRVSMRPLTSPSQ